MSQTFDETLLESLFRNVQGRNVEEINWKLVEKEKKIQALERASYDVDFLALHGTMIGLLNDGNVLNMLGSSSGTIFSACSLQIARCSSCKRILAY